MLNIRIEPTAQKKQKPDQTKLGFGNYFTDHMFLMNYTEGKGWYDPRIVPYQNISLDPSAMVFHYAQELFDSLVPMTPAKEKEPEYITVPLYGVEDDQLLEELTAKGIVAYTNTVDSSTYILSFLLTSILPLVSMVLLMMFMYRGIGGKGGMGGLGGLF